MRPNLRDPLPGYGVAALAIAIVTGLTYLLRTVSPDTVFVLYYTAVALAAWIGGMWPGLFAAFVSALTCYALFLGAPDSPSVAAVHLARLAAFSGVSTFLCMLTQALRHSRSAEREAKRRVASILESISDIFFAVDRSWRFTFLNRRCQALAPEPIDALLGRDLWESFPTLAGTVFEHHYREAMALGRPAHFEAQAPVGGRWYEVSVYPSEEGLSVYCRDVSDRHRAEDELSRRAEQLRLAVEVAGMGAWEWDIPANRITWSDSLPALHGLGLGQFGGDYASFLAVVHPDDRERVHAEVTRTIEQGADYHVEFRTLWPDGTVRRMDTRAVLLRDGSGRPWRLVGMVLDVTDRLHAEASLRGAIEAAESANRAKDRFLAVLSHELRTPLTPVLAAASALRAAPEAPESLQPFLEIIHRNVVVEAQLIDDLLDVTRIAQGKLTLSPEVVDAHRVLDQAIETVLAEAAAKDLRVESRLRAARHHVHADPVRLQQVFWNLIRNAVKFTPDDGRIQISTRNDPSGRLVVEVADSGVGIEPESLARIFDPFEQGEPSVTRRFGGLGLGLAICRSVVEAHGGRLSARSGGKGRGATFAVELATLATSVEPAPLVDIPAEPQAPGQPGALRLLLVEDNPDTLAVLGRLLRVRGHRVATASSLAEAVAMAEAQTPDLIVSDLGLPDGSGLDLMRLLAGHCPRGIALSGYGSDDDIRRSRAAGFAEHLTKPVDFGALEAAIARVAGPVAIAAGGNGDGA